MTPEEQLLRIAALQRRFINFDTDIKRLWKRASFSPQGYVGTPAGAFDGQYDIAPSDCTMYSSCTPTTDACAQFWLDGTAPLNAYDEEKTFQIEYSGPNTPGADTVGGRFGYGSRFFLEFGTVYLAMQNPGFTWVQRNDGKLRFCLTSSSLGCNHPSLYPGVATTNTGAWSMVLVDNLATVGDVDQLLAVYTLDDSNDLTAGGQDFCFDQVAVSNTSKMWFNPPQTIRFLT